MLKLLLNCSSWQTRDDFYDALLATLGAPDWHGRNFNALWDSIGTGGINKVEPPYCFVITGFPALGAEARHVVADFCDLVRELKESGLPVDVSCE
jgi:RNAse (barnase) inhibitor barstar